MPETTLSRSAGPVCITRLAMRPAKSFWKNVQLCRTTCQWLCQRIRLVRPGAMAWLVIRLCNNSAAGDRTSMHRAMPSNRPVLGQQRSGAWLETSDTTRPMKTGMVASNSATKNPATNSATNRPLAWRAKCQ